ncbi:potassium-transporting ATPase subunit KdpA [Geobacter sulfurreducens]|uniref:Potassium-transporting ATPase potassium-binding subunit n=1 Tax=Geobacter sulfurreducens (strain ATCC 51573 / DSM 12127 / PCA) TaxID=243231 RepID=KDPA_GEOSL|nr:potassium-transporting ATPase subunit KdpA [Geobacter sulfurreducens]Q74AB0.1 RecName: Full=Potassium-transporting ATPase potassium-binding subunit; AltName: Full=ATP phosphohydrolase [potassium-transporting] A chain; AltName: Full=Potassium-binding and translocating subunit A; AltName: Full=Potassium-translocating ATPase A chain [Geobacter sulfurreducens PCA]HMN04000.1 potassium-transporting ATPase subunit KdpA [Geobacter anodireducens]AAR35853.1 potassium-transporting ATPase, A subunit [Geo
MNVYESLQTVLLFVVLLAMVKPLGTFMARVFQGERTILSPVLAPAESLLYGVCGVNSEEEMDWKRYARAMVLFNLVIFATLFAMLMLQHLLPLNPQKFPAFSWQLALNTAVSFTTNTNWQAYAGEQAASYFTQMVGLTVHNFVSAATGIAVAIAVIRGFARRTTSALGNFWVDLTRATLYILVPISLIAALVLVSQGVIQNFSAYQAVSLVQPVTYDTPKRDGTGSPVKDPTGNPVTERVTAKEVTIPMGPVASQEAIKELGTNGGGFFNANSAHPFENPTPLSNMLEILLILLIPFSLTYTFGAMVGNTRQGWTLLGVMLLILLASFAVLQGVESGGNPLVTKLGVHGANMEGKDTRFGLAGSSLFTVATTGTSCGAVNTMHDSLTPIGGMIPMSLMLLGELVPGGVGSGLYTMLAFAVIAVFVSGLMIGRTPEYLGKKIEVREMWMSVVTVLAAGVMVLILSGIAMISPSAVAAMANPGAHGLSEVLYAFASMANNNGSAFAGLSANTTFYNILGALAMIVGRFAPAVAVLAMAGSLAEKKYVPPSLGTLPTDKVPFALWLTLVILIVGALTFFPALSLGPIVEHLTMTM